MSIAPLPTPLQHLGGRRFSFYPPIRNLEPNEWLYRRATWSECVVVNASSGEEVWIPRLFIGEVSRIDEPLMIVGLHRELEWRDGAILPRQRRVIELPVALYQNAVHHGHGEPRSPRLAPVVNIRLEPKSDTRIWKWIGVAAVLGAVACTIVADVARQSQAHQRQDLFRGNRSYLQLGPGDDFAATIRKLGVPPAVQSRTASGGRVFRLLEYPGRRYVVVLFGQSEASARYLGTLEIHGRILDAIRLPDGASGDSLLRSRELLSLPLF